MTRDQRSRALCLWLSYQLQACAPGLAELLRRVALPQYLARLAQYSPKQVVLPAAAARGMLTAGGKHT
jgi:hypothetical protein